jgi:hypothetical protein
MHPLTLKQMFARAFHLASRAMRNSLWISHCDRFNEVASVTQGRQPHPLTISSRVPKTTTGSLSCRDLFCPEYVVTGFSTLSLFIKRWTRMVLLQVCNLFPIVRVCVSVCGICVLVATSLVARINPVSWNECVVECDRS